jgi:hypothetical protein
MTQQQYPPGPYRTIQWGQAISINSKEVLGLAVVNPYGDREKGIPSAQDRAIADLFAAAPDLLAALERCADVIGHYPCSDGKHPNGFVVALEHARAAIAKARGIPQGKEIEC